MSKQKSTYFCQNCGVESPKWVGRCPGCGEWNTYLEAPSVKNIKSTGWADPLRSQKKAPRKINEIEPNDLERMPTLDTEFDRILGGGIVPGSVILMGGEPGIGKSTLLLQLALNLKNKKILYASGEESEEQIRLRADRMPLVSENCYILTETDIIIISQHIRSLNPDILIVDSIQTMHTTEMETPAGSISQIKECTARLIRFAKETGTPVFIIGHITKEGQIAGPKVLEHMVDTVLQFEGDAHTSHRIIRTIKNRFGSTAELGIYEMTAFGLRQVSNPSEILLSKQVENLSGTAIAASLEGTRAFLIEIQSLVSPATYSTPQRSSTGYDYKRLNMLLAVLERRTGYKLIMQDVFLNVTGGLKTDDPAVDLAVCASIVSSLKNYHIPAKFCFAGEVGLGGEIRAVSQIEKRVMEAQKLGFKSIFVSGYNKFPNLKADHNAGEKSRIKIIRIQKLEQAFARIFTKKTSKSI